MAFLMALVTLAKCLLTEEKQRKTARRVSGKGTIAKAIAAKRRRAHREESVSPWFTEREPISTEELTSAIKKINVIDVLTDDFELADVEQDRSNQSTQIIINSLYDCEEEWGDGNHDNVSQASDETDFIELAIGLTAADRVVDTSVRCRCCSLEENSLRL